MDTKELIKTLRDMLPEKVDYADLVCAEGFAHGYKYVYEDPESYFIEEAANKLEELNNQLESAIKDIQRALWDGDDPCDFCKHKYHCNGTKCDEYIEGFCYHNWKWSCEDLEWGTCAKLKNTLCNGCDLINHWEWKGR